MVQKERQVTLGLCVGWNTEVPQKTNKQTEEKIRVSGSRMFS